MLVTAWDMPFLTADLLRALMRGSAEFDVFAAESGGPRGIEPMCAVYGPQCGPAIRDAMTRDDWSAVSFHSAIRVGTLPRAVVEQCGSPDRLFFNINEPADLERAEMMWPATH